MNTRVVTGFFCVLLLGTLPLYSQSPNKDIEEAYLVKMGSLIKNDTPEKRFLTFALNLFKNGSKPDSLYMQNADKVYPGIGVQINEENDSPSEATSSIRKPYFKLCSYRFQDFPTRSGSAEFHRKLYFGERGGKKALVFFVTIHDEAGQAILDTAIQQFLYQHTHPRRNAAYQYVMTHQEKEESYEALRPTNGKSTLTMGEAYKYFRQNGPYLVMLQVYPDTKLHEDDSQLWVTDYSLGRWFLASVFVLDPSKQPFTELAKIK